jgi:predicted AlkP superfamily pyrophosphatase or phosphodiesterase
VKIASCISLTLVALASAAQAQPTPTPATPTPKLIVAISVDQFSADLFAQYRAQVTGGLKRMQSGVVFPSGFQAHAATETCPGHATILTGAHPSRSGVIANNWFDPKSTRLDKDGKTDYGVYCAEDESAPGSTSSKYVVSPVHLKVPTLGDRLKALSPATRVVSVAGKDRAAVMMGGHKIDQAWWWDSKAFVTYKGITTPPLAAVARVNALASAAIDKPVIQKLPAACTPQSVAIPLSNGKTVGTLALRTKGDARGFRASDGVDGLTIDLAIAAVTEMKLGKGAAPDVLAIGLSGTDYVGHTYGTAGAEMCAQIFAVDAMLARLFTKLDAAKVPYVAVLTADHGGLDMSERSQTHAAPDARRIVPAPSLADIGKSVAAKNGLSGTVLVGEGAGGDVYLTLAVPAEKRAAVIADTAAAMRAHPDVELVMTASELNATTISNGPPEDWPLTSRARASFDPARSGDVIGFVKSRVTPIPSNAFGYVATHGSIWNYDRRVPILFWWPGAVGFEQPLGVNVIDIMPTLASLVGLPVPAAEIDGRCLDLDRTAGSNCR